MVTYSQNFHQLGIYALTSAHFKSRASLTKTEINSNLCYKHKYLEKFARVSK